MLILALAIHYDCVSPQIDHSWTIKFSPLTLYSLGVLKSRQIKSINNYNHLLIKFKLRLENNKLVKKKKVLCQLYFIM